MSFEGLLEDKLLELLRLVLFFATEDARDFDFPFGLGFRLGEAERGLETYFFASGSVAADILFVVVVVFFVNCNFVNVKFRFRNNRVLT